MPRVLFAASLLISIMTGAGCYIPAIGQKAPSREELLSIEPGVTTRADVFHRFGQPSALESSSYLVYEMEKGPGHLLIFGGYAGVMIPTGNTKNYRMLFEFDSTGIVERWHLDRAEGYLFGYSGVMSPANKWSPDARGLDSLAPALQLKFLPDSARIITGKDWFAAVAVSPACTAVAAADTKGRLWFRNLSTGMNTTLSEPEAYGPLPQAAPSLRFNQSGDRLVVLAHGVQFVDPAIPAHMEIPERLTKKVLRDQREAKAIAVTHDAMTLARGDGEGWVRVGGRTQKAGFRSFRAHRSEVLSLAFSLDGALLATAGDDQHVRVWRAGSWGMATDLRRNARAVAFSPDGSSLAILCKTHVEIWPVSALPVQDGKSATFANSGPSHAFLLPYDSGRDPSSRKAWPRRASLGFSPDARFLAAATGSAVIYDLRRRRTVWRYLSRSTRRDDAIADIAFASDGNRAVVATKKGIFTIYGGWEALDVEAH